LSYSKPDHPIVKFLLPLRLGEPFGFVVSGRSLTAFRLLSEPSYKPTFSRHSLFIFADYMQKEWNVNEEKIGPKTAKK